MNRLRSIVFTVLIALMACVMTVFLFPALFMGEDAARRVIRMWCRPALWLMKLLTGVDYRVEGRDHIPTGGALVVSNHQSLWETIALNLLLPKPVMILKKELLRIPVYGLWVHRAGNIAIDREGGPAELKRLRDEAAQRIADGAQIVVFPEGTRVPAGETRRFQPGVAGIYLAAHAPCHPVAHDSGRFWRQLGGALTPGAITLRFLPPIETGLKRREFQDMIERIINDARPDRPGADGNGDAMGGDARAPGLAEPRHAQ